MFAYFIALHKMLLIFQQVEHFGSYEMLDVNDKYPYTYMDIGKVMTLIDITKQLLNDPDTPTDIHVKAWIGPGTVFLNYSILNILRFSLRAIIRIKLV